MNFRDAPADLLERERGDVHSPAAMGGIAPQPLYWKRHVPAANSILLSLEPAQNDDREDVATDAHFSPCARHRVTVMISARDYERLGIAAVKMCKRRPHLLRMALDHYMKTA